MEQGTGNREQLIHHLGGAGLVTLGRKKNDSCETRPYIIMDHSSSPDPRRAMARLYTSLIQFFDTILCRPC
ncbi:hypothetical protein MC7420_7351 [Coleofasciculus chthonoplastes PCC 7420]|uniref:Uncharacterized protein n=1 Tax=Coleofasciculus chthonoplastes PCC 7420 TaxID=118168 RepID=B4VHX0_9CYAN|nr:hypothetical protein MC7420_7351 [Coleofasciculus chthonoplastes PCC 7420]